MGIQDFIGILAGCHELSTVIQLEIKRVKGVTATNSILILREIKK